MQDFSSDASNSSEGDLVQEDFSGGEQWEDWEEQNDELSCTCLFSSDICESVEDALRIDSSSNGFDLKKFREKLKLSFYDTICLVNYIRSERLQGRDPRLVLQGSPLPDPWPWKNDSYLVPIIENDAMILYDWEDIHEEGKDIDCEEDESPKGLTLLQEHMQGMDLNDPAVFDLVTSALMKDRIAISEKSKRVREDCITMTARLLEHEQVMSESVDRSYFSSYAFFDIHKEMLQDSVRTDCYRKALEENSDIIKGGKVLDVGCGTGILSMFASRGGASKVVGVDGSAPIAKIAGQICEFNGFDGKNGLGNIIIISSKIEDLEELPVEGGKVDIIVSEWMGYALLFESMLDSVLIARDLFLRPGGAILPDIANIYIALGTYASEGLDFWEDIYGLSMTPIAETIRKNHLKSAQVRVVDGHTLVSDPVRLHSLDLASMKRSEQDFSAAFEIDSSRCDTCSCLVLWFDTEFSPRFCQSSPQVLTSSPHSKPTHWAQTVLPFAEHIPVGSRKNPDSSETVVAFKGRLSMSRQEKMHRTLDISVEYAPVLKSGKVMTTKTQLYSIGVNESHF